MGAEMNIWKYFTLILVGLLIWFWMSFVGVKRLEMDNLKQEIAWINIKNKEIIPHRHRLFTGEVVYDGRVK